jgi:serine/threonine-protein kinase
VNVALGPGTRLGAYEILSLLGRGGMGEVYRARDTRLEREVAVKVLPDLLSSDSERLARFEREAKTLAALNHPNIAHIHGIEDALGTPALVMELVEGPTLADRIAKGPIPPDEALPIAKQIADALEAAHEQGIVHRDLKPTNIKVREDGAVRVLDFGLAKALDPMTSTSTNPTLSPTLSVHATQAGVILGTAAYMAPEQARGRGADRRSDVWAFGVVVYEMLTGKRAFDGESITDIVAAIVRDEPNWTLLPSQVTPAMRTLLARCLAKDGRTRIPDMSVVRFLLADAETSRRDSGQSPVPVARRSVGVIAAAAAVAGAIVTSATAWWIAQSRPAPVPRPAHFVLGMPPDLPVETGGPDRSIVIAPDGAHIVSVNGTTAGVGGQLMVRSLDQTDAQPIKSVAFARAPFISPDSRWIGYFDANTLKKVPITGGPPVMICNVSGGSRGSTWGPDKTIVFATNDSSTGLLIVSADGGEPKVLTKPDPAHGELDHLFPSFLPGGRFVLFTIAASTGSVDDGMIAVLDLKTGERKTVVHGGSFAEYAASGHLLYASGGALHAIRFDLNRLEVLGDPVIVVDHLRTEASGATQFAVAPTGAFVYVTGGSGNSEERTLVWVDRQGREQPLSTPVRAYIHPRLSPDGARVAVAILDREQDIWILDLARHALTPLTFGPAAESYPLWTNDGRRVVFRSARSGIPNVFWQLADGTGSVEQLTSFTQFPTMAHAFASDGQTLVIQAGSHLATMRLDDRQKITMIAEAPGIQGNAALSPDGRWLAYNSTESGQPQIFVRPFPNVDAGRWQVSNSGGVRPAWGSGGQELFFVSTVNGIGGSIMAVRVHTTGTFTYDTPTKLFDARPYYFAPPNRTYDVTPDGQRFLMIKPAASTAETSDQPAKVEFVLNWFEELKPRVPLK